MNYPYRQRIVWPLTGDALRTLWRWVSPLVAVVAAYYVLIAAMCLFVLMGAKP